MNPVTPSQFKTAKPQFASVADNVVQSYLDLALMLAGENWPTQESYDAAQIALTCHLMTLDGLGDDPYSTGFSSGNAYYSSIKTGDVTLTRYQNAAQSAGQSTGAWLSSTPCGQFYLLMLRNFKAQARLIMGGVGSRGGTAYAKDGWWYW